MDVAVQLVENITSKNATTESSKTPLEMLAEEAEKSAHKPIIAAKGNKKERAASKVESAYTDVLSFVGELYLSKFQGSGFGGGIDSVLQNLTDYIVANLIVHGKAENRAETIKLCEDCLKTKMSETEAAKKSKIVPLALKITVALDIHSGSIYSHALCEKMTRIFEESEAITGVTPIQAKELIDGLTAFAAGQGINIK